MNASPTPLGNLNRLREISVVVARHGFGRVFERAKVFQTLGIRPKDEASALPAGRRLRLLLTELGPTFVKLGQVLSTRSDLFAQEVIRELSQLQDSVPPFPFDQVRKQVETGLGRTLEDAYSFFDEQPLASASIAQVHRARTRAGIEVIVKVQRPAIRDRIQADVEILYSIARFLESVVEETHISSPTGIVQEFENAILGELDFSREAENVKSFLRVNQGRSFIVIPHVVEGLCAATVLTLERLDGPKITELDPEKHDRAVVAKNLIEMAFVHLFEDGQFHGDPHPGNLLVVEGNRIGMIDFGLVGRLTRPMQEALIVMCLAISLHDAGTLARLLYKVGVNDQRVNLSALTNEIQALFDRYLGQELQRIDARSLLADLLDLARKHRVRVPREYAVLAKSAITIEGVVRRLYPEIDVLEVAMPYARRLLYDRLNPASSDASARRMLLQMQGFATDLPSQLAQVLMDLERGKLNITNRGAEEQLTLLVASVRLLGISVFAAALVLASALWLSNSKGIAPVALLVGAVALFVGGYSWLVLGVRPRKIRLRKGEKRE